MSDEVPHDQLKHDLNVIGVPSPENIETKGHVHSKISVKVKTEAGILVFENGILVKVDK